MFGDDLCFESHDACRYCLLLFGSPPQCLSAAAAQQRTLVAPIIASAIACVLLSVCIRSEIACSCDLRP